ncbi:MAG TPA: hypothetical protein VLZ56_05800 [Mycoplana sp.]|nr:hypothetical protein [Mycoplana sp.]
MSGAGFTPGPWIAQRTVAPRGWNIEARDGTYTVAIARDGSGLPQNAANARLIAAAPELLEALKRCRFDSLNMSLVDLDFCRAAIAKATGVTS